MSLRAWLRPPRQLVALFLLVTLLPSLLLVIVGWKLSQRDRAAEQRQSQERREQAATAAVAALESAVTAAEQALRDPGTAQSLATPDDAVLVMFDPRGVAVAPPGRLVYWPVGSSGREAPPAAFEPGEALEFRQQDPLKAVEWFRARAVSADPAIRAGALIRLARNLRKVHQPEAALAAYEQTAAISGAAVDGAPADMLARWAQCGLLEELGRSAQRAGHARLLSTDLARGRWQITRAMYDAQTADVRRWMGSAGASSELTDRERLSAAVDLLWQRWTHRDPNDPRHSGREAHLANGEVVTALWTSDRGRLTALIAGPEYVQRQWLGQLAPLLAPQHLRAALRSADLRGLTESQARRAAADTGLPWTVTIESAGAAGESTAASSHQLVWVGGLVVLLIVVCAGTYVVVRAVTREFAVARLQSDFVAAVSHEFRTPLTSLRQLTEILIDGRITDADRHATYYRALERQSQRLHRLVESLLDFGRMEAGTSPYRREPVDLAALVAETVQEVQAEVDERGFRLVETVAPGFNAHVLGDREALKNALRNLLDNAVKYSAECRTVWVDVASGADGIVVRVRDRGLGIPRCEQREIFKKFVRGSRRAARESRGQASGSRWCSTSSGRTAGGCGSTARRVKGARSPWSCPRSRQGRQGRAGLARDQQGAVLAGRQVRRIRPSGRRERRGAARRVRHER